MKTIIFIIDQVCFHGGIERVLSVKANYLAKLSDYNIIVITSEQKEKKPCYQFNEKITFIDIAINYNRQKSYFHPENLLKIPKHIVKLKSQFRKIRPDVVVVCSHSTDTYFLPFISKKIPKVKEYHYSKFIESPIRNSKKKSFKKYFLSFLDYINTKYDKIIALNKTEASFYTSKNIIVIPNPLTFYPKTISNLNEKTVVGVGRIAEVKGYDQLIDIWELVNKENSEWKLKIYGEGEPSYIEYLQTKIESKNLENVISFEGTTDNVEKVLSETSIFVMTSKNECFPLVLLEAQATGLPIVSYDCPYGPRNILNKETGVLIPTRDKKQFSKALLKIIGNDSLRYSMGAKARENAEQYKVSNIMNKWHIMFEDLISINK